MKKSIVAALALAGLSLAGVVAPGSAFAAGKTANLSIATQGGELTFDKADLSAKPGQEVKLTFSNKAPKDSGLQHNWVLVNPGTQDAIGQAGMTAGPDKGYVPDSKDIIAHTKLINPGEKDTITFKAPDKAGDYPFMCTFPGHAMMMKGALHVK